MNQKIREAFEKLVPCEVEHEGSISLDGKTLVHNCALSEAAFTLGYLAAASEYQRDAERYQWLRDDNTTEFGEPWAITRYPENDERNTDDGTCPLFGKELDAAIDAAKEKS